MLYPSRPSSAGKKARRANLKQPAGTTAPIQRCRCSLPGEGLRRSRNTPHEHAPRSEKSTPASIFLPSTTSTNIEQPTEIPLQQSATPGQNSHQDSIMVKWPPASTPVRSLLPGPDIDAASPRECRARGGAARASLLLGLALCASSQASRAWRKLGSQVAGVLFCPEILHCGYRPALGQASLPCWVHEVRAFNTVENDSRGVLAFDLVRWGGQCTSCHPLSGVLGFKWDGCRRAFTKNKATPN